MTPAPRIAEIQRAVAAQFGTGLETMCAPSRRRAVARPRQVAMYLSRRLTSSSFHEIGDRFGGRHYTTAIHAVQMIEHLLPQDEQLLFDVEQAIATVAKIVSARPVFGA